ncbi:hypothetical protein ELY33_14620 [Vreelandella andesensis]|uniref:Uncharacterized protein n=1 Tax=Vreelandella andesensis TaxID=447567 RepID=A0A433KGC2_9GAMM|nr:hypothetical protein [Halomonas andesensis]RUR27824.1 hypothetical protein ELY33_14620 [Halomonas andesensis]
MSQITSSSLPPRKPRHNNPLGRMIAEALDNQLLHYAYTNTEFTIPDVRNVLHALPEFADYDKTRLRYYVRDRVHALERLGLATRVGMVDKKRAIFRLHFDVEETVCEQPTTDDTSPVSARLSTNDDLLTFLEKDRQHLNTCMHIAISEAEYYKKILDQYPTEKARIIPLLQAATEKSNHLKGKWDANLTLRSQLTSQELRS